MNKERRTYIQKSIGYIKKYRSLSLWVVMTAFLSSLFEGFSLGTIIPLFQGVLGSGDGIDVPFISTILDTFFDSVGKGTAILLLLGGIVVMTILKNVFMYINMITVNKVSNFIKRDLQKDLFQKVLDARLQYFHSLKSGHVMGSISIYTESVASFIFSFLSGAIVLMRITIYAVLLFIISWKFTLTLFLFGFLGWPVVKLVLKKIRHAGYDITQSVSKLHFRMMEMFGSVSLMKLYGTQAQEKKQFGDTSHELAINYYRGSKYSNILAPLAESAVLVAIFFITLYLIVVADIDLALYVPAIVTYLYVFAKFYKQLNDSLRLVGGMYNHIEPFKAYEHMIREADAAKEKNGATAIGSLEKDIQFDAVSFSYDAEHTVLDDVTFRIPKGSFTALVGPTGVGKTTLANLIAGLYTPTSGEIRFNGVPSPNVEMTDWRSRIGYVSQDLLIRNDTIAANIAYGAGEVSQRDIEHAAQVAHIHDFIQKLPDGYQTILGDRGVRLSGGQRQRLSIARAVIRKPEILILDEATSSLDMEVEKRIQEALAKEFGGKTIVAIAHRLSTVMHADNIIVLHEGRVVEQGNHETLMKQGGFYSYLQKLSTT